MISDTEAVAQIVIATLYALRNACVGRPSGRHVALIPQGHIEGDLQKRFARGAGSYG